MASQTASAVRHLIVGTAGHIDHGKSSLVKALTGTDPDRLPEEQARGMTIDLGFAVLELQGVRLGIVDVPGHERFVRTMVAGASGIDLALLLVAVDDGVMPQTREHLEILDFLGVGRGIVLLSKADLAGPERINEVGVALRAAAEGTAVAEWPQLAISTVSGMGLDRLRAMLGELAADTPHLRPSETFRLAIDRLFAVKGRGTVVTGSVLQGAVAAGAALELLPAGRPCRVREVQSHGRALDSAGEGQRAALNLTGVDREQIARGDELATPGFLTATRYLDVRVRLTSRRETPLPTHRRVRVSLGTREEIATLVSLEGAAIAPGEVALAQLRFAAPVVAVWGQRMILRDENAQATLGGAVVFRAVSRRVRATPDEVTALSRAASAVPDDRLREVLRGAWLATVEPVRFAAQVGVAPSEVRTLLEALRTGGRLVRVAGVEATTETIAALRGRALDLLRRHHAARPLEPGLGSDRFVGWLDARSAAGCGRALLAEWRSSGAVEVRGPYVAAPGFRPALSAEDATLLEKLVAELVAAKLDPPEWAKLSVVSGLSKQRAAVLADIARGDPRLVLVAPGMFVDAAAVAALRDAVRRLGQNGRRFRLAEVRDALGLSRRSVLPLLEYLDRTRFTRRVGDERVIQEGA